MFNPNQVSVRLSNFFSTVYILMAGALALTGVVAYTTYATPAIQQFFLGNPFSIFLLFMVQLGLVMVIGFGGMRMASSTLFALSLLYAVSLGIMLSAIFFLYSTAIIYKAFFITAGMYLIMSVYGCLTKTDLTALGNICFMGLIGLIFAMLFNMFFKSQQTDLIISIIGVIIFTLLTAFDTQNLKRIGQYGIEDDEIRNKVAIFGALTLYMNFINIFLFLLRIMGNNQRD